MSSNVPPAGPRKRLQRKTALKRSGFLKRSRPRPVMDKVARLAWFDARGKSCMVCGGVPFHIERHHVISKQRIHQEHREDLLWDQRNALDCCMRCHSAHTHATRRIPRSVLRLCPGLLAFAVELFGTEDRATDFLAREYPR